MKTLVLGDYTITFTPSYTSFRSNDKYFKVPNTSTIQIFIECDWAYNYKSRIYYLKANINSEPLTLSYVNNDRQTIESQYNELISLLESYSEPSILD